MKPSVGIIGFGSFGHFVAKQLGQYCLVKAYDSSDRSKDAAHAGALWRPLPEVCECDFLILCVPLKVLEKVLLKIIPHLRAATVLVEVCSVKMEPLKILKKVLPKNIQYISTHPMFGPKSGANGIVGFKIVICESRIDAERKSKILDFLKNKLKLVVIKSTAKQHDEQAAYVQALTHFIVKGFAKLKKPSLNLTTSSFDHFAALQDLISWDSEELFRTIQNDNPYAKKIRAKFLNQLMKIDDKLN